jgi:hypothetical protein
MAKLRRGRIEPGPPETQADRLRQQVGELRADIRFFLRPLDFTGRPHDPWTQQIRAQRLADAQIELAQKEAELALLLCAADKLACTKSPTTPASRRSPVSLSLDLVDEEDERRLAKGLSPMRPKDAQGWLKKHHPGAAMFTVGGLRRRRNRS